LAKLLQTERNAKRKKNFYFCIAEVQRKHYLPFFASLETVTFGSSLEKVTASRGQRQKLDEDKTYCKLSKRLK